MKYQRNSLSEILNWFIAGNINRKGFFICFIFFLVLDLRTHAQNWEILSTNTNLDLLGMQCLAPDTLIMFGDDGILLKSYNGGTDFTSVQNGSALIYTAAFFMNTDTGFVGNGGGNIQRTYNGGSNWANTGGCTCFITDICFSDQQHGVYGGLAGVFRSTNGGTSWSPIAGTTFFVPAKLVAFDDSVFMTIYNKGIYRSTDYGESWSFDTLNFTSNYSMTGLSFPDDSNGFALSGDGQLFATTNQGVSWNLVATAAFSGDALLFTDLQNGYFISGQYKIYKTTNGGLNWELDYTASEVVSDLAFDGHAVYASGQHGLALKKELVTGITDPSPLIFKLFPNPAQDEIRFSGINKWESVTVYNSLGTRVFSTGNFTGNKLDISGLSPGVYLIRIDASGYSSSGIFQKL